jgi:hypothetical protein
MPILTVCAIVARFGFQRRGEKNISHRYEPPLDATGRQGTTATPWRHFGALAQWNPLPILSASAPKRTV